MLLVLQALVTCSPKINIIPLMINKWKLLNQILPWAIDYRFGKEEDDETNLPISEYKAEDWKLVTKVRAIGFEINIARSCVCFFGHVVLRRLLLPLH